MIMRLPAPAIPVHAAAFARGARLAAGSARPQARHLRPETVYNVELIVFRRYRRSRAA